MFIHRIIEVLTRHRVNYALVGGYAVALHGILRGTVDVDLAIALDRQQFLAAEQALGELGLRPRLPVNAGEVFDFRQEYIENRNLRAWSFYNEDNPLEVVDILITEDAGNMATVVKRTRDLAIVVAAVPELIRMKQQAARPQDLEDIKHLEKLL